MVGSTGVVKGMALLAHLPLEAAPAPPSPQQQQQGRRAHQLNWAAEAHSPCSGRPPPSYKGSTWEPPEPLGTLPTPHPRRTWGSPRSNIHLNKCSPWVYLRHGRVKQIQVANRGGALSGAENGASTICVASTELSYAESRDRNSGRAETRASFLPNALCNKELPERLAGRYLRESSLRGWCKSLYARSVSTDTQETHTRDLGSQWHQVPACPQGPATKKSPDGTEEFTDPVLTRRRPFPRPAKSKRLSTKPPPTSWSCSKSEHREGRGGWSTECRLSGWTSLDISHWEAILTSHYQQRWNTWRQLSTWRPWVTTVPTICPHISPVPSLLQCRQTVKVSYQRWSELRRDRCSHAHLSQKITWSSMYLAGEAE